MRLAKLDSPAWWPAAVALILACALRPAPAAAADPATPTSNNVIVAITEPCKRLKMAFNGLGVIENVAVKEGDAIKDRQLLMGQDDEIEKLVYDRLKAEADSNARIEAAVADLNVKRKVFERKNTAGDAYNKAEIEEAELDVTFREKQLEIAKLEAAQNKNKAAEQKAKLDRMKLYSKFDGFVEKIEVWEGEVCDPSKPAIIIVKNDPMYVTIRQLKTAQVALLKVGQSLDVRYPGEEQWQAAKIWYISPVADATAGTQLVKLELPNPTNRATGLDIEVKLPDNVAQAGEMNGALKTASNR